MTSYVEIEIAENIGIDAEQITKDVMTAVLDMEGCPYEAQVNLLITDNDGIWEFNREHRKVDAPTDVLSFPMIPFEKEADFSVVEEEEADDLELVAVITAAVAATMGTSTDGFVVRSIKRAQHRNW